MDCMTNLLKRTWAEVDLDCIAHNFKSIRAFVRDGCKVMAVVKADAYGHGAPYVAKEYERLGADYFGVSNIDEAAQLRSCGIKKPILILGYTPPEYAGQLISQEITQTVFSLDYAKALSDAAKTAGGQVKVHIKIDSGMSRIGFVCHDTPSLHKTVNEIKQAAALSELQLEGVFTHFAVADEMQNAFTERQFDRFMAALHALEDEGIRFEIRHCCNSAGLLNYPEMQLDMVRPGIILYGLGPAAGMPLPNGVTLKPVMSLKTVVSQIKKLPPQTAISYGMRYYTDKETKVATLPIGYADGFARSLSNCADVLIGGKRARIVGRVCMDQCMADVTGIENISEDSIVTIVGIDGDQMVTMDEIAAICGTISYETICLIGKRVPRVFIKDGETIGYQNYILP